MTPYYADDLVTIYHGDARDALMGLHADLLLTDPPYGIGIASNPFLQRFAGTDWDAKAERPGLRR